MSTRIKSIAPGGYEILCFPDQGGSVLVTWVEHQDGTYSDMRATQGGLPLQVRRKFTVTAQEDDNA